MAEAILLCSNVSKSFGSVVALENVDLEIRSGEIVGLIGPNGSGKSTLINLISGFYRPESGEVLFNGKRINGLPPNNLRRQGMSRTFQNLRLFDEVTVLDNLLIGLHLDFVSGRGSDWNWAAALLKAPASRRQDCDDRMKAMGVLEDIGLVKQAHQKVKHLSYGQKKRLELARAVAVPPVLLLLDEPSSGLSREEANEIRHFFERPAHDAGLAVLLVEHRLDWVLEVSDRVAVLDAGRKIAEGPPSEVAADTVVHRVYVGDLS
jgi:branched-chain amino acid transport system ATP-binding protein